MCCDDKRWVMICYERNFEYEFFYLRVARDVLWRDSGRQWFCGAISEFKKGGKVTRWCTVWPDVKLDVLI